MQELEKNFSMSFDELRQTVSNVIGSMTRDATEFAERGVTQLDIDAFETQGNEFEVFPSDNYYQSMISEEVEEKNTARKNCEVMMRKLSGYVQQEYGLRSAKYKRLGMKGYQAAKDSSFLFKAREVARVCEEYLATLSAIGMTQQQIDDLAAEAQTMEDEMNAVASKVELRDEKTQERVTKANALYANLRKYCDIGQLIWEDVDEAKYNDYIIYKTVHHGLSKPQNIVVDFTGIQPNEIAVAWDPVVEATEYEVYSSQVNLGDPPGEFSLADTVTDAPYVAVISSGFRYYYKVRAKNVETQSDFSDEAWVDSTV